MGKVIKLFAEVYEGIVPGLVFILSYFGLMNLISKATLESDMYNLFVGWVAIIFLVIGFFCYAFLDNKEEE